MSNNPCVLQVCAYAALYPGNFIGTQIKLAKENQKRGYKTIFAFCESAKELAWCQELEKEYKVYYLPVRKARVLNKTYREMRRIYRENNIVIAHSHFELYDMATNLMATKGTKVFWHLHDSLETSYQNSSFIYKILWKLQYRVFSKNVKLLSVSEKAKRYAIRLGFKEKNASFFANGIDLDRMETTREPIKYDFLMFGWDYYRKGVDLMLEAERKIEGEFNIGMVALEGTWDKIDIKKYEHLERQEAVKNVSDLYCATKCFLHISRSEGLSYALLEAIYAGCIVICSDIEQNLFAKEFPTVVMVENENVQMIAQEMKRIINNERKFAERDFAKARDIIRNEYSLQCWISKMQKIYFEN